MWTENFDFSAGVDADEVMFIDPEELRLQESESVRRFDITCI